MWDQRYDTEEYVYGIEPNRFLASMADKIPKGRVLCLAEGEGRNAVFLAKQGCRVLAVDSSPVGLKKAEKLAASQGVSIETQVVDLAHFEIEPGAWDGIVSIFAHVPSAIRKALHRKVVAGLRSGGVLVLEAYTPKQLEYKTGGPPNADMMMTLAGLREELAGLEFLHAKELDRDVIEGRLHTGKGAVVQVVAKKTASE
ncbi:MAG: class I SAM-dependent methyltransferase [Nitrospiraceae bacterium]|nr:class I SAM-dependent methyltransferase [Nitrospiraceae bacterium]